MKMQQGFNAFNEEEYYNAMKNFNKAGQNLSKLDKNKLFDCQICFILAQAVFGQPKDSLERVKKLETND